jgi:hypothetical protein
MRRRQSQVLYKSFNTGCNHTFNMSFKLAPSPCYSGLQGKATTSQHREIKYTEGGSIFTAMLVGGRVNLDAFPTTGKKYCLLYFCCSMVRSV